VGDGTSMVTMCTIAKLTRTGGDTGAGPSGANDEQGVTLDIGSDVVGVTDTRVVVVSYKPPA
jgi:hypothetical protein